VTTVTGASAFTESLPAAWLSELTFPGYVEYDTAEFVVIEFGLFESATLETAADNMSLVATYSPALPPTPELALPAADTVVFYDDATTAKIVHTLLPVPATRPAVRAATRWWRNGWLHTAAATTLPARSRSLCSRQPTARWCTPAGAGAERHRRHSITLPPLSTATHTAPHSTAQDTPWPTA